MQFREPKLEDRNEQLYMGIRTLAKMSQLDETIPQSTDEVLAWLEEQGIEPVGAPFIRYHVINMKEQLDISLGVPVASNVEGNGHIEPGVLPAGRYATLIYTGVQNGIPANAALIEWAIQQGLVWDHWEEANGDAFASRYESFLTDPEDEPDMDKWETEVAIKVASDRA